MLHLAFWANLLLSSDSGRIQKDRLKKCVHVCVCVWAENNYGKGLEQGEPLTEDPRSVNAE